MFGVNLELAKKTNVTTTAKNFIKAFSITVIINMSCYLLLLLAECVYPVVPCKPCKTVTVQVLFVFSMLSTSSLEV